jgi:hypothetical protein
MLLEEPYGHFGNFNPTGHAAVYLARVCADSPTHLRRCAPGEPGVVISRYHYIAGYDWLAIPLVPYLYAVDSLDQVPAVADLKTEHVLRNAWRRQHLQSIVPNVSDIPDIPDIPDDADSDGPVPDLSAASPHGEWYMLVGAAYSRKIYGFELDSTPAQDDAFIAAWNDRENREHFNLFFSNCADFARSVLDFYYPHAVHRNWVADTALTTPKQVAKSILHYGQRHPELHLTTFIVPQVSGSIPRSHHADGIAQAVFMSKKYVVPLALVSPIAVGGLGVAWAVEGRFSPPKEAPMMSELRPSAIDVTRPRLIMTPDVSLPVPEPLPDSPVVAPAGAILGNLPAGGA